MGMYDEIKAYHHIDVEREFPELLTKYVQEEIAKEIEKSPKTLDDKILQKSSYIDNDSWNENDEFDMYVKIRALSDLVGLLMKQINKRHC